MIFTKEELNNFKKSSSYEWLISNGIGSFASSTVIGLNTRKYHGLMVAAISPPAKRNLILSKVDESIKIGDKSYEVSPWYISAGKATPSDKYAPENEKLTNELLDLPLNRLVW